jgi:hypothetical protein
LYNAGQKYEGAPSQSTEKEQFAATVNLKYAKMPLYFKYQFSKQNSKFGTSILFGANVASLLQNTEVVTLEQTPSFVNGYTSKSQSSLKNLDFEFQFTEINNQQTLVSTEKYSINKNLYNKLALGLNFGVGFNYAISPKFNVYANIFGDYGLTNIEYTDSIKRYTSTGVIDVVFKSSMSKHAKYNLFTLPTDQPRYTYTTNRAIGLQLGFIFLLGNKEEFEPKKL